MSENNSEKNRVNISFDEKTYPVKVSTSLNELLSTLPSRSPSPLAAVVNGELQSLSYRLYADSSIVWLDHSNSGSRLYKRGLLFVMLMACTKLFPDRRPHVSHSLDNGIYCLMEDGGQLTLEEIAVLHREMESLIKEDLPIYENLLSKDDAVRFFQAKGDVEKAELLSCRRSETLHLYSCGGFSEYLFGHMPTRTGQLSDFKLLPFDEGFVLMLPAQKDASFSTEQFSEPRRLQAVLTETKLWGEKLGVGNITQLNRLVKKGDLNELILVNEVLHSRELSRIADSIYADFPAVRVVLVAGPSSSGKTTFTQRLSLQFRALGLRPVTISLDDYFLNRCDTPLDEYGKPDFESVHALDLELFNKNLHDLIDGRQVLIPRYDFVTGARAAEGVPYTLAADQLVIIEGLHGLNEDLTAAIPAQNKRKVYVSALTQLNMDDYTPIPSSDNRLFRRIVRDMQFRNASAEQTLLHWPSVRRGEFANIFPFQEQADYFFNSSLIYELTVLRPLVEPALEEIKPSSPVFLEAKRLKRFIQYFAEGEAKCIPLDSILQEFLGKSCFFN